MNRNKRLLIYYPSNKRSVPLETMIQIYLNSGVEIYVLTLSESGDLHKELSRLSIRNYNHKVVGFKVIEFLSQLFYLIRFCWIHKIDWVHSHLQDANVISISAQFFIKSRVIIFRHHFHFEHLLNEKIIRNRNEVIGERMINLLARKIVVPSRSLYQAIIRYEKADPQKFEIVPYIYNFAKYSHPDYLHASELSDKYQATFRIIMCSRLVKEKQHLATFEVFKELIKEGLDIIMFILDDGPERRELEDFVKENNLQDKIIFFGYRNDIPDFMVASDLLVHPSISEASNSAVKEMGILGGTVAVCKGIGDFEEYIIHNENGFLMDSGLVKKDLKRIIEFAYTHKDVIKMMGSKLREKVISEFGISQDIIDKYKSLLK